MRLTGVAATSSKHARAPNDLHMRWTADCGLNADKRENGIESLHRSVGRWAHHGLRGACATWLPRPKNFGSRSNLGRCRGLGRSGERMPQTPDRAVSKRIVWKTERRRLGVYRKANSPVFFNTHYPSSDITKQVTELAQLAGC